VLWDTLVKPDGLRWWWGGGAILGIQVQTFKVSSQCPIHIFCYPLLPLAGNFLKTIKILTAFSGGIIKWVHVNTTTALSVKSHHLLIDLLM
jgi:hypothetical protein